MAISARHRARPARAAAIAPRTVSHASPCAAGSPWLASPLGDQPSAFQRAAMSISERSHVICWGQTQPLQTLSKIFTHACHREERFARSRVVQKPPARDPQSPAGGKPVPPRLAASVPAKVRGRLPIFVSPKSHAPSSSQRDGICNAARARRGVGLPSPGLGAFRSQIDCGIPGRPPDRLVRRPSFWGEPLSASRRRPN